MDLVAVVLKQKFLDADEVHDVRFGKRKHFAGQASHPLPQGKVRLKRFRRLVGPFL